MSFIASIHTYGQGEMDAFMLSRNDQMGTARGIAMGGAFGALGGEITGVAQNPAGIGVYRSSELVTTLGFMSNNIETNTAGFKSPESKFKFAFDNVGYVGYTPLSDNVFKSFNFGFSYNRLKNFDRNYTMSGKDIRSSLSDYMAAISNGIHEYDLGIVDDNTEYYNPYREKGLPWLGILGYNVYNRNDGFNGIINNVPGKEDQYESIWPKDDYIVENYLNVSERGHIESYDFTIGTSVQNKLYLGATFSITDIKHRISSLYTEDFVPVVSGATTGFDLDNWSETTGSGYQLSIGAIFKPHDILRLGLAYHSPTWYNIQNSRSGNLIADLPGWNHSWEGHAPDDNDIAVTDYKLNTPDRWVASVAAILGTKAIVSIDYEYTDFGKMKLKDMDGFGYAGDNDFIKEDFKGASTLKAGIEYRVTPQLSVRAGYSWAQSPLEKDFKDGKREVAIGINSTIPHFTLEGDASTFSYGLGYRFTPQFYMDVAFSFKSQTDELYAFSPVWEDGVEIVSVTPSKFKNDTYKGLLTLGYKF